MVEPIERKIYFFRTIVNGQGRFDPADACRQISDLSFEDRSRYLEDSDGKDVCAWTTTWQGHHCIRFGTVRRSGLPQVEVTGRVDPLELNERAGLVELTHVMFLPRGIVGAEFNFYGPRVSRLSTYLNRKCTDLPQVTFDMLVNDDAQVQVDDMEDVRMVSLRLRRDYAHLLSGAHESLPDAMKSSAEFLNAPEFEVVFRPKAYSRDSLGARAARFIRNVVGDMSYRDGADHFKAKGMSRRTGKVETFDFLKDLLVSQKQVVRQDERYRTVNSESMFRAIREAYDENQDLIEGAAGLAG